MSFPKIVHQKGSFGQIRKKPLFRFCRPILDVFGLTLLKSTASCHVYCELRFDILFENANCSPSGCFITIQLSFLSNFSLCQNGNARKRLAHIRPQRSQRGFHCQLLKLLQHSISLTCLESTQFLRCSGYFTLRNISIKFCQSVYITCKYFGTFYFGRLFVELISDTAMKQR